MNELNMIEIILIMIIPFYFIFRWILIKLLPKKKRTANILAVFTSLILTPLIYLGFSFTFYLFGSPFEAQRDFDKQAWNSKTEERFRMQDDLVRDDILKSKSQNQILKLLGNPDQKKTPNIWIYDMGISTSGFAPIVYNLKLEFENNQVSKVQKIKHVD